jgi:hypothetical protein
MTMALVVPTTRNHSNEHVRYSNQGKMCGSDQGTIHVTSPAESTAVEVSARREILTYDDIFHNLQQEGG